MRDALPNASFIGFTGTPIALEDRDTRGVFGDSVSIYDIQDAVDDKATVPIYYESRLAKLDINRAEIEALNQSRPLLASTILHRRLGGGSDRGRGGRGRAGEHQEQMDAAREAGRREAPH